MKNDMYSQLQKLETLLTDLSESLGVVEQRRYTANQYFKADNLNLAEGATLTINMNNALFSLKLINQCHKIIENLKPFVPHNGNGLDIVLENHEKVLIANALKSNGFRLSDTAKALDLSFRQLRYRIEKNNNYFKQLKEKENYHGSGEEENSELGPTG